VKAYRLSGLEGFMDLLAVAFVGMLILLFAADNVLLLSG
jgi:hypothetical protein